MRSSLEIPDQQGRAVMVTGANSGIGLRTAEALAARGAHVLMGCRNAERGERARERVAAAATGPPPVLITVDVADLASVRSAAEEVRRAVDHLDVLINNAGVMLLPRGLTVDGFELHLGTNHLGHVLLTSELLDLLLVTPAPRVVSVSSVAAYWGRIRWRDVDRRSGPWLDGYAAYCQSKLAQILFTVELDRRAREARTGLIATAAHPGLADTNLVAHGNSPINAFAMRIMGPRLQSDDAGALPSLHAATAPDVRGGSFFGPDGRFGIAGLPAPVRVPRQARDGQALRRFWALSCERTGASFAALSDVPAALM